MKVIVLGGGVIGTTTAYYLATQGAEVTLVDRQPGPALETSFANAGQVSPGYSAPWAAPGIPFKALCWIFEKHAPLAVRPDGSLHQLRWMAQLLRNCSGASYRLNKERMVRVAEYSKACLGVLRTEIGLSYEARTGGTLQVFRTQQQLDAAQRDIAVLQECGVPYELLDATGIARCEPGLSRARDPLVGALRLPNDETGDCHLFTQALATINASLGVTHRFGLKVDRLTGGNSGVTGVVCGDEILRGDRYVMAFGSYSRATVRSLGLDLPIYPVKGYSLTFPIIDESCAPLSTVLDETYKVAITRFDERIRVGGMAELCGYDVWLNPARRATLEMVTRGLFRGGDLSKGEFWAGLRPMTPDGTPILGATALPNLYLNTGHGTLGWTMACGSARLVADLVLGRRPDIDTEGLSVARYGRSRG